MLLLLALHVSTAFIAPSARLQPHTALRGSHVALEAKPDPLEGKWYSRIVADFKEGYDRSKASFETPRAVETLDPSAGPLRKSDKLAGVLLTMLVVEAVAFAGAFLCCWLLGTAAIAGAPQARLFAAAGEAAAFRTATRLPRLLAECVAVRYCLAAIESRPVDVRAEFVKDRASQTIALLGVIALTVRAANKTLLAGSSAPAAATIAAWIAGLARPLTDSLGFLAPVADLISAAARLAWAFALRLGARLVAIDAAARTANPINAALYGLSDLERYLAGPAKLLVAALGAFYHEVVLPILKTVGFITVQTLG